MATDLEDNRSHTIINVSRDRRLATTEAVLFNRSNIKIECTNIALHTKTNQHPGDRTGLISTLFL